MENLYFEGNSIDHDYRPTVELDVETGKCEFSGLSYPWDPVSFYVPVINWIKQYTTEQAKPITFNMKMEGFNTTSGAKLMEIFRILEQYNAQEGKVIIHWFYEEDDDDMLEAGQDFQRILKIPVMLSMKEPEDE